MPVGSRHPGETVWAGTGTIFAERRSMVYELERVLDKLISGRRELRK